LTQGGGKGARGSGKKIPEEAETKGGGRTPREGKKKPKKKGDSSERKIIPQLRCLRKRPAAHLERGE